MVGEIFLGGGGSGEQTKVVDTALLKGVKRILYVPLAWPNDDFNSCRKWFDDWTLDYGSFQVDMLEDWKADIDLGRYDVVYVGGGNTFKLLHRIREGGLGQKMIEFYNNGGRIFGGSAGAIIWGKDIGTALLCKDADVNEIGLKDLLGFDHVGGCDIQAHYEPDQMKEHQRHAQKAGRAIFGIPEESALVISGKSGVVVGTRPIYLINARDVKEYDVGAKIELK